MTTHKAIVKFEKFGPRGEDDSADILVDGMNVGYIERIMTGEWASASSRQTIERVAGYSVTLWDERADDRGMFDTRAQAKAFVIATVKEFGTLAAAPAPKK